MGFGIKVPRFNRGNQRGYEQGCQVRQVIDMTSTLIPTWPPVLFDSSTGKRPGGGEE